MTDQASAVTNQQSKVRLLTPEEAHERLQAEAQRSGLSPQPQPNPTVTFQSEPASPASSQAFHMQMMAVMKAIAYVLSARLLLVLSTAGAFVLAFLTTKDPDVMRLVGNVIYDVLVLGPLVYLTLQKG